MYKYLRIHRPETGTSLVVLSPIHFAQINEQIACQLDGFVQYHFQGFYILSVWTEFEKDLMESHLTV